ncbi:hypothetical protein CRE_12962 [Caenorhabditis remanei]|uniref:GH18 domain-containing protein n=1 Tax=Caenorhabditis remanei TaxID=31234 RepID=E3N103_CAERE|nr:hypothetical protein CRE_12962 [Caenorhabditis remanei]
MGVPFFGAYWKNVEGPIDAKGEMWFTAKPKTKGSDQYEGGYIPWRNMKSIGFNVSSATWHQDSRTPFIWLPEKQEFLGFENARSLREKVEYTKAHSLGGITIWSIEMDNDNDTLLNSVYSADLCYSNRNDTIYYNCG